MLLLVPQLVLLARGCFGGRGYRSSYIFHGILRLPAERMGLFQTIGDLANQKAWAEQI